MHFYWGENTKISFRVREEFKNFKGVVTGVRKSVCVCVFMVHCIITLLSEDGLSTYSNFLYIY